ncbi:MAG: GDP-mannose 4,6-dehydratase [Labilithrix sp.]|nr:GDP-mannose 4,6-dehydratase [Labilithrix sp.]
MRNKKVLVTGADGFIGSHLVERLVSEGASVRALCLYNSQGSWGWLDHVAPGVRSAVDVRLGDIRDARQMESVCAGMEIVLHLAALIAIPYSYAAPESFVDTNVRGTLNVVEAARRAGVARFVHTSTSEVYGTPDTLPIRETHPLQAQSPYAATKVAADQLVYSYYSSFALPAVVLRPFNTFGPRQSARAVLIAMLTQLLGGRREIHLGRLDTKRDMTFVLDTVDGFVRAAQAQGIEGKTIQLGTGTAHTIEEMFRACCTVLGVDARVVLDERRLRPDASEVLHLQSAPNLAKELLGWQPRESLETGLEKTAAWLSKHLDQYKPETLHV